jgi:hypothetical protein
VTDRREERGLDPDGIVETWCPSCEQMVVVSTQFEGGVRHELCEQCGRTLGAGMAGSFEPAGHPDA